jgi:hypothetical protein
MSVTKRNDAGNTLKGGYGIDSDKDAFFTKSDQEDIDAIYGRGLYPELKRSDFDHVDCDYSGAASNTKLQRSARQGNDPLLGRGDPTSAEQTGMRKRGIK